MTRRRKNSLSPAPALPAVCFAIIATPLLCPALLAQPTQQFFLNTPDIMFPTGNTIQINALNLSDSTISGLSGGTIDSTGAVSPLVSAPSLAPQAIASINLPVTAGHHVIPFLMTASRSHARSLSVSYSNIQVSGTQTTPQIVIPGSATSWFQGTYSSSSTPIVNFRKPLSPFGLRTTPTFSFHSGPVPIAGGGFVLSAHNEGQTDAHVTFSGWDASGANILADSATIPAGASTQSPATAVPGVYSFLISSDKTTISPNLLVSQSSTFSQQFTAAQWGIAGNGDWGSYETHDDGDLWGTGSH